MKAAYYDYVLGTIPLVMLGIPATLLPFGVSPTTAIPVAGVLAMTIIGHAMFVNSPVASSNLDDGARPRDQQSAPTTPVTAFPTDD